MRHEQHPSGSSESTWRDDSSYWKNQDYFAWAKTPGFNPMKAVAVVAAFAVFPPLGAAALLYFMWRGWRGRWHDSPYAHAAAGGPGGHFGHQHQHRGCGRGRGRWTGNAAFDQHQAEVMQTLRDEREAFHAFRAEQRRKRDEEAFNAFRAAQANPPAETPKAE